MPRFLAAVVVAEAKATDTAPAAVLAGCLWIAPRLLHSCAVLLNPLAVCCAMSLRFYSTLGKIKSSTWALSVGSRQPRPYYVPRLPSSLLLVLILIRVLILRANPWIRVFNLWADRVARRFLFC